MRVRASTLQRWARFVVVLLALFGAPARAADPAASVSEPRRSWREIKRERDMRALFVRLNLMAALLVVRFALEERDRRRWSNPNRNGRSLFRDHDPPAEQRPADAPRVVIRSGRRARPAPRPPRREDDPRQG